LAGRANEIAQNGHVGAICADAPCIYWQSEPLGQVQIHTRVVQFRQAETLRRLHAIQARRIDRPGRAVTPPGTARQLVILLPIAFVPSRHSLHRGPIHVRVNYSLVRYTHILGCTTCREGSYNSYHTTCEKLPWSPAYSYTS